MCQSLTRLKYCSLPFTNGIPLYIFIFILYTEGIWNSLGTTFNLSLKIDALPTLWKSSFLKPTYKNGDLYVIKNYRGIQRYSGIVGVYRFSTYKLCNEIVLVNMVFYNSQNQLPLIQQKLQVPSLRFSPVVTQCGPLTPQTTK